MSRTCTRCGATLDVIPFGPVREEWCAACWWAVQAQRADLRGELLDEERELEEAELRIYQARRAEVGA